MMNHGATKGRPPTFFAVVQSDSVKQAKRLCGIDVLAAGTLKVEDSTGTAVTYTFTALAAADAGGAFSVFPYRLIADIVKVWDTGTTISDANLIGLIN